MLVTVAAAPQAVVRVVACSVVLVVSCAVDVMAVQKRGLVTWRRILDNFRYLYHAEAGSGRELTRRGWCNCRSNHDCWCNLSVHFMSHVSQLT